MARDYDIAKASGRCCRCGRQLAGGEEFVAALFDAGEEFRRDDFCGACWEGRPAEPEQPFSLWRCRVPEPEKPRRQLVGDEMLVDLFEKLAGQEAPAKLNLRFVLALMLMRKKLLVYDRTGADEGGSEVWTMHYRGEKTPIEVTNPQLDEEKVTQVAGQLGALFEVPT